MGKIKKINMKYTLYEDQERVKKSLGKAVTNNKNVLCYAPTGFGKTILSKVIIDSLTSKGKRVLFTVPRIKLATQTRDKYGYGNLLLGSKSEDNGSLLTIASVQSLYSRKHTDHYDFIFIDECHFAHGSEYVNYIFDTYTSAKIIGLSATPIDENGYLLRGYDEIVSEVTVKELINGGRLCDVNVYTSLVQPKLSEIPTVNGDYNQKQASEIVREEKILSNTMSEWKKYGGKMKTLVFASDIKHSEVMKDEFIKLGYTCGVVHSQIKDDKITATYSDFNTNKIQVLINVDMATFGFDEPGIECLLFARPIKSLRLYKQMVGRGLRTFKGKDKCLIIDCANVVMDNGFPTDEVPFIKKPVITKTVDRILDLERETSGEVTKEISKKRIDYLTKVGSLFDLYNQKKYTKESDFQDDVRKFLKSLGFFMWRQNSGAMFKDGRWIQFTDRKGLPDIAVIYNGVYIGIELKMKTGAFTKHQKETLPLMIEAGVYVYVVDNFEELFNITESIRENIIKTSEGILIKNKLLSMSDQQKKYRKKLGI
jgi:superfamily II DNA or RNA helicase